MQSPQFLRAALTLSLAFMAFPLTTSAAQTTDAERLKTLAADIAHCPLPKVQTHLRDAIGIPADAMHYSGASAQTVGRNWVLRVWHTGPSVESFHSNTIIMIDAKRCRAAAIDTESVGHQLFAGATQWTEGKRGATLRSPLLALLGLTAGSARSTGHALGRLITRRQLNKLSITPFSESPLDNPYSAATWQDADAPEWLPGRPRAQTGALWRVDDTRSVATNGMQAPSLWRSVAGYELWRAGRGQGVGIAIYVPKTRRHAWLLATPIGGEFQGHISFLGHRGRTAYLQVGAFELVTIHPTSGSRRVGDRADLGDGGRLTYLDGDQEMTIQLDPPHASRKAL